MVWKKLGRLFSLDENCEPENKPDSKIDHPLLVTHTANPLPMHLEGDVYRVFYSGRDERSRSSVSFVDIDILKRTNRLSAPRTAYYIRTERQFFFTRHQPWKLLRNR